MSMCENQGVDDWEEVMRDWEMSATIERSQIIDDRQGSFLLSLLTSGGTACDLAPVTIFWDDSVHDPCAMILSTDEFALWQMSYREDAELNADVCNAETFWR